MLTFCLFSETMSIARFLLISDSMAKNLELPNTEVVSMSGARNNDWRVIRCLNEIERGQYQQVIFFIGGNGLSDWGNKTANTPHQVRGQLLIQLTNIASLYC